MPPQNNCSIKPVIGLTGGPGSGKTAVAKLFEELGCAVIDADHLSHEALKTDAVKQAVRSRWGDTLFGSDGQIVRSKLGQIVFADPNALRQLEAVIHPLVHHARAQARERHQANPNVVGIIEDCPLLLENGLDQGCDAVVFIDTPDETRLQRVRINRGWDEAELRKRDLQQMPLDNKRESADYVIHNDRDFALLQAQVRCVLQTITQTAPR